MPDHQFGFRRHHGTIEQIYRLVEIHYSQERKEYCSAVFLDISQAFNRMWHDGLLYKIKVNLPISYLILNSYLHDRFYQIICGEAMTELYPVTAEVPQGSVLGSLLYLLYTANLPMRFSVMIGTFADDTAILTFYTLIPR